ncbi:DUF1302 domain-containing protein [Pseudomonas lopnurensis]|uniref:DUF1302 domain-containing protein n=1 Tax=Pseudomonas lopnurensis TaxID=1477517 RepID=UPI0028A60298|nr:DUF1302 family protein [Pseudomonas lopnurensis]
MRQLSSSFQPSQVSRVALAIAVLGAGGGVSAKEFDLGNPDWRLRWDNTVRYNLGIRMEDQDRKIMNTPTTDESDGKFDKHDIVTNRLDLLTEIDLSYQYLFGARVSAAAWYDHAYRDHDVDSNIPGYSTSYDGDRYSSEVKRYVHGPSGEILDAFVWTNLDIGPVPLNIKVGRHTNYWGEGLLFGAHAVSYSQAPSDGVKAVTSPGIETKEVFLPVGQISMKAQLTDSLSVAAQKYFEWEPTRMPYGGTFFGPADPFFEGPDRFPLPPGFNLPRLDSKKGRDSANWGVMAKLNVEQIESTFGAYYREFDDYQAWLAPELVAAPDGYYRLVYPRDVKLYGLSFSRIFNSVSVGMDLSYRKNGALNATGVSPIDHEGPRGDTIHFVANAVYGVPRNFISNNATLTAEFAYSHLDKVTKHRELYKGDGYVGCTDVRNSGLPGGKEDGCSTDDYYAIAVNYTPQYLSVLPSWDLDVPLTINYGIHGNAATAGGGSEGALSWSVGAKMTYIQRHEFSLRYADTSAQEKTLANGGVGGNGAVGTTDRGWLVFTYKTSF